MDLTNVLQLQGLKPDGGHKPGRGTATTVTTTCIFASCLSQNC